MAKIKKQKNTNNKRIYQFFKDLATNILKDWIIFLILIAIPLLLSIPLYFSEICKKTSKIKHIMEAVYVSWITLTTVGYGDFTPVSVIGRLIACIDGIFGLLLFGLLVYHISKAREQ